MRRTRAVVAAATAALVGPLTGVAPCGAGVSGAVEGRAVTVEVLPGLGGRVARAAGINDRGQVVARAPRRAAEAGASCGAAAGSST